MEGYLDFDKDSQFNEVLPLLYLSLKYQCQLAEKPLPEALTSLELFPTEDPELELLPHETAGPTVEFLARCLGQEGRRSDYWLDYLSEIAMSQETPRLMRRAETLRAAVLLDRRLIKESQEILEALLKDFEEGEEDTHVLALSVLAMARKGTVEGLRLEERAREISGQVPGGSALYERRQWLQLPTVI